MHRSLSGRIKQMRARLATMLAWLDQAWVDASCRLVDYRFACCL